MVDGEKRRIPELEYVQAARVDEEEAIYPYAIVVSMISIAGMVIIDLILVLLFVNTFSLGFLGWVVLAVMLTVLEVSSFIWSFEEYKTDGDGLSVKIPYWQKSVKWSEVREVRTTRFWYVIRTDRSTIKIPTNNRIQFLRLAASVWQHLYQVGKADGMHLRKEVLGFWQEVPMGIPNEAEWSNRRPYAIWLNVIGIVAAGFICLLLLNMIVGRHSMEGFLALELLYLILPLIYVMSRVFCVAYFVSIRNRHLKVVTLFGTRELDILDLRKIRWLSGRGLELYANDKKVIVPCSKHDPQTRMLLLVLIKLLRENHGATVMPIPSFLNCEEAGTANHAPVNGENYA